MGNPHALPPGHRYWTLSEEAAKETAEAVGGTVVGYWAGESYGYAFAVFVPHFGNMVIDWASRRISPHDPNYKDAVRLLAAAGVEGASTCR